MGARGLTIFLVAGEASGDALGAALMEGLGALAPGTAFEGVGGPRMQALGLASLFPMDELSVMGLAEILPRYPALRRRMIQTADAAIVSRPDALVTIDAPAFGLSVARRVRAARPDARLIHYVAPSVWAWRPGRAAKLRGLVDLVLALLPFEPPLLEAAGVPCRFVGHPVAGLPPPDPEAGRAFRAAHGLSGEVVCVLPGSRRSEVARLAPVLGRALAILAERRPGLRAVVPAAPGRGRDAARGARRLARPARDRAPRRGRQDGGLRRLRRGHRRLGHGLAGAGAGGPADGGGLRRPPAHPP